jgi:hypothetical protein
MGGCYGSRQKSVLFIFSRIYEQRDTAWGDHSKWVSVLRGEALGKIMVRIPHRR